MLRLDQGLDIYCILMIFQAYSAFHEQITTFYCCKTKHSGIQLEESNKQESNKNGLVKLARWCQALGRVI